MRIYYRIFLRIIWARIVSEIYLMMNSDRIPRTSRESHGVKFASEMQGSVSKLHAMKARVSTNAYEHFL